MKRILIAFGALCLLALSLILMIRPLWRSHITHRFIAAGPDDLAREEAAARQAGIPLTAQELQKPLPPPAQNAAPLYTKLTKLLHDKPLGLPKYAEGIDAFHTYTPAQIAAVRRALAARQDVMTLIHQAVDKPHCVFVRDWSQGANLNFPEYQPMREAARLLKTESYLLALQGRYADAVRDQSYGFRVAAQAASEPSALSYMVAVSCQMITLTGMSSILALAGPNPAIDAQVAQAVRAPGVPPSLRFALATEPALMQPLIGELHQRQGLGMDSVTSALQAMSSGKSASLATPPPAKGADSPDSAQDPTSASAFIDAEWAEYLSEMRRLIVLADHPNASRRAAFAAAGTEAHPDDPRSSRRIIALLFLPSVAAMGENDLRVRARQTVLQAAATLLGAKAKTGAFPEKLPPGFTDPFTGKPLLYRCVGSNFIVYSAGPTGQFNGTPPGEKVPPTEVQFRYPAVPVLPT